MAGVVTVIEGNRHIQPPQVLGFRWPDHVHLPLSDLSPPSALKGLLASEYHAVGPKGQSRVARCLTPSPSHRQVSLGASSWNGGTSKSPARHQSDGDPTLLRGGEGHPPASCPDEAQTPTELDLVGWDLQIGSLEAL